LLSYYTAFYCLISWHLLNLHFPVLRSNMSCGYRRRASVCKLWPINARCYGQTISLILRADAYLGLNNYTVCFKKRCLTLLYKKWRGDFLKHSVYVSNCLLRFKFSLPSELIQDRKEKSEQICLLSQSALATWNWLYLVKIVFLCIYCTAVLPFVCWIKDFQNYFCHYRYTND